ncbi:MAG: neutral/alkaline non-lysosomal ceramidase N-terminal domain-containing protein [Anaerolineae bacterium]
MHHSLQIGVAEVLITPPLGVSMAGYYQDRKADDIHDDLYAHAIVLSHGEVSAAVVVCDLIGLDRGLTLEARQIIEQHTGIPTSQVMMTCTHTHTGPVTNRGRSRIMSADAAYLDVLARKIADSVRLAFLRRQAATIEVGRGQAEGIAFNRRFWMQDGTLRTNPYSQVAEIDRPAGPVDPEVGILLTRSGEGSPIAVVSNYALHADEVGGTAICADYQGVQARVLKQVLGRGCAVLCPNGCCGDINHRDITKPMPPQKGFHVAERSGMVLAGEVMKRIPDLMKTGDGELHAGSQVFDIPLRVPSEDEVGWAEKAVNGEMHGFDDQGLAVVRAHRILGIRDSGLTQIPVEVSVIAWGDWAMVGLPGEVFVEHGLQIKEHSPFPYTFVAELCNDSIGYVPTQAAYEQGGYEPNNSRVQPGSGERMVEAALGLLQQAKG